MIISIVKLNFFLSPKPYQGKKLDILESNGYIQAVDFGHPPRELFLHSTVQFKVHARNIIWKETNFCRYMKWISDWCWCSKRISYGKYYKAIIVRIAWALIVGTREIMPNCTHTKKNECKTKPNAENIAQRRVLLILLICGNLHSSFTAFIPTFSCSTIFCIFFSSFDSFVLCQKYIFIKHFIAFICAKKKLEKNLQLANER